MSIVLLFVLLIGTRFLVRFKPGEVASMLAAAGMVISFIIAASNGFPMVADLAEFGALKDTAEEYSRTSGLHKWVFTQFGAGPGFEFRNSGSLKLITFIAACAAYMLFNVQLHNNSKNRDKAPA